MASPGSDDPRDAPEGARAPTTPDTHATQADGQGDFESYQTIAETVGGVPSFRLRDNLIQGILVVLGTAAGALLGATQHARLKGVGRVDGLLLGAVVGLIASVVLSGLILMILGWIRAARKISKR